jgi:hypothetical protein
MPIQYSFENQEPAMQPSLRQTYQPKPDTTPRWLRRLWLWL